MGKRARVPWPGRPASDWSAGCRRRLPGLAIGAGLLVASAAQAQAPGAIAPPSRDELAPPTFREAPRPRLTLTIDGQMERRACALDAPEHAAITIRLSQVRFTGAERAPDAQLARAYDGYLNRDLPVSALCDIRDRATALLEAAGYLAAVEIPPQSLGDGEAELRVVLGRLVAVRARGNAGGAEAALAGYLGRLVGREVFRVAEAERYLLLASDIPGTQVRLSLRPAAGGEPGDLVGEVAVISQSHMADFSVQNYGSRALGRFGALARGQVYGLTGLADRTSLALFTTLDFAEQQTIQLAHDMRLGSEGLALGGQLTLGWTEPEALPGFAITSETLFATLEATYPLLRSQRHSLWLAGGLDLVDQDVEVNAIALTRDRVRTGFVRLRYAGMDARSIARRDGFSPFEPHFAITGQVELRQGLGILGANRDCRGQVPACTTGGAVPPARLDQNPRALHLRASLAGEYRPVPLFAMAFDLRGQASDAALPSFEEFTGGNYGLGRGYDPAAVIGDAGIGAGLELRYGSLVPSGMQGLAVQPYVFTEVVRSWQRDPGFGPTNPDGLWSAGGGLRFVRGADLQGDLTVALPLERTDTQARKGDVRVLFTLSARLSGWRP